MKLGPKVFCSLVALAMIAAVAYGDILIFNDGYAIEGRVREWIVPLTNPDAAPLNVPKAGTNFWLDDGVRKINFSPGQVKEPLGDKTMKPDQAKLRLNSPNPQNSLPVNWSIDSLGPWNDRWEQEVVIRSPSGKFKMTRRITEMTPEGVKIEGISHTWVSYYNTSEFDPETLRTLVFQFYAKKKEKDLDVRVKVYRFLLQAGFTEQAGRELNDMLKDFPSEDSNIKPLLNNIQRIFAVQIAEAMDRSFKAGMLGDVEQKLATYVKHKLDDLLDEKTQLQVQALKDKMTAAKDKLKEAKRMVLAFADLVPAGQREAFQIAAAELVQELNYDTVDRVETFLNLGADFERAVKDKRQPEQAPADVLALGLTGWVRGSNAAEPNPAVAFKQWEGWKLLQKYLATDNPLVRKRELLPLLKAKIGVDEAMQMLQLLPPVDAHTQLSTKPQALQTQNDGKQYPYHVQLPPGYSHGRRWPVLIALHFSKQKPADAAGTWSTLAAQHGYIVVAPQWSASPNATYQYTSQEHQAVIETLRDLRRRFQIDSDRVFLFGVEQGANMAMDVGLSHPDQFAGVIAMSGSPAGFARRYWSNAQNLPLYIINGSEAASSKDTNAMFMDFIRCNYPSLFFEYKGRMNEWFGAEPAILFDWMNRKRRAHPLTELGKQDEEFKTHRQTDNQFYWIGTNAVLPGYLNSAVAWNNANRPATLRAKVSSKNEIFIRTTGVTEVTILFGPNLVNYGEKVSVNVNSSPAVKHTVTPQLDVLLETLYQTGDRQQLCFARLEIRG